MKNIFYIIFFWLFVTSCAINKNSISKCQKPDFQEWKESCLDIFDNTFDASENKKNGTILAYVRREIANINTQRQNDFFCQLKINEKDHNWDRLTLIYHYLEGEVNFTVQSFVFQDKNTCYGITWDTILNKTKKITDFDFFLSTGKFHSDYINNGVLIISRFNRSFELEESNIYYGASLSQLSGLIKAYP